MSGPDQWSRQVPVNFVKMCNGSWRGGDWQQTPELRFEVSHFLRCTFIDSWIARRLIVIWQRPSCWQGWQGVMGPANVITLLPNWHNTSTLSMSLSTSIFSESASVVSKSDTILTKKKRSIITNLVLHHIVFPIPTGNISDRWKQVLNA